MPVNTNNNVDTSIRFLNESTRSPSADLDKDAFLKILVAQLQNQDPTSPMDNTQMVSQMTQYSMLEQMTNMTTSSQMSEAYNMLGKGVYASFLDGDSGRQVEILEVVDSVFMKNGTVYLQAGDYTFPKSSVVSVYDLSAGLGSAVTDTLVNSSQLVGKYVAAKITGEDGAYTSVTGKVSKVFVKDGAVVAKLEDGTDVLVTSITDVADAPLQAETESSTGQDQDSGDITDDITDDIIE